MQFNSNKLRQIRHQSGLSTRKFAEALHTNNASISRFENGLSQPPAEFVLRLARFALVDVEWLYDKFPKDVDRGEKIKGKRSLGERLRETLQHVPIDAEALPFMIGSTAQDLFRAAKQDQVDDNVLWLLARMSGVRIGWLKSGGDKKMLHTTLGGITYSRPVIGKIVAGEAVLAQEHIIGWEPTTVENVAFFFRVEDGSMDAAGILNSDLVGVNLCDPLEKCRYEEDICVLRIPKPDDPGHHRLTLKFIRRDDAGRMFAVSADPLHTPMVLDEHAEDVRILGVVGQIKRFYLKN